MDEEKKENVTAEAETEEMDESQQAEVQVEAQEAAETTTPAKIGDLNFLAEVRTDLPELRTGDVIRVAYRVIEGGKERTQIFEGTVIALKNRGIAKTVTVRKTSFGIAVERILPLNSKLVQSIEVKRHSKIRRAKLYYLRNLKGKAARLKELR